jgi:YD repeat-containing protein
VILDNGEDGTEDLVASLPSAPYEIVYRRLSDRRRNHGEMMNEVCSLAKGEILFTWDSDDWSAPGRLQDQIDRLNESGKSLTGYHELLFHNEADGKTYKYSYNATGHYASGTSQCFRRVFWERHPFLNKERGADGDFSAAARDADQLISVPGVGLMVARAHADSTCPPPLGQGQFPACNRDLFPSQFFEDLKRFE